MSPDQELGRSFRFTPDDLPPPKATRSVSNGPLALPFKHQVPKVPEGFTATLFANFNIPRRMLVLPNGDVVVAEQKPVISRSCARSRWQSRVHRAACRGFNQPCGLAWRHGHILVADQDGIWQVPAQPRRCPHRARREQQGSRCPARSAQAFVQLQRSIDADAERRVRGRGRPFQPAVGDRQDGRAVCGCRFGRQHRHRAGGKGNRAALRATEAARPPSCPACAIRAGSRSIPIPERSGQSSRSATGSATAWFRTTSYGRRRAPSMDGPTPTWGNIPSPASPAEHPEKVKQSKVPDLLFESHSSAMDIVFSRAANSPFRVPWQRLRGFQGLVEPLRADGLQGGACGSRMASPRAPTRTS